jgi:hypothetical protein
MAVLTTSAATAPAPAAIAPARAAVTPRPGDRERAHTTPWIPRRTSRAAGWSVRTSVYDAPASRPPCRASSARHARTAPSYSRRTAPPSSGRRRVGASGSSSSSAPAAVPAPRRQPRAPRARPRRPRPAPPRRAARRSACRRQEVTDEHHARGLPLPARRASGVRSARRPGHLPASPRERGSSSASTPRRDRGGRVSAPTCAATASPPYHRHALHRPPTRARRIRPSATSPSARSPAPVPAGKIVPGNAIEALASSTSQVGSRA